MEDTGSTSGPGLKTLKARWEVSGEGPDEPRRKALIDLAFRLAAAAQPGFAPPRTHTEVSSSYEVDEAWGGADSTSVYRLGDAAGGVEVTDRVTDPQDGMTPFESSTEIHVYGLPSMWALVLHGYFVPLIRSRVQPMSADALLPEAAARAIALILEQEVGAAVEMS